MLDDRIGNTADDEEFERILECILLRLLTRPAVRRALAEQAAASIIVDRRRGSPTGRR